MRVTGLVRLFPTCAPVWKSNGAFVPNRCVDLHAIDATCSMAWRWVFYCSTEPARPTLGHWLISTQACATRDADGNAPLHSRLPLRGAGRSTSARARPGACGQRLPRPPAAPAREIVRGGPLHTRSPNGRLPRRRRLRQAGHHAAHAPPPAPGRRSAAAARRPSKRVARTVTPDLHNVVPPFDDDYDALGLGAGCGWLDDIFDEDHAIQPSYEESLEDLGLDEVKARCAAAGLDTTVRKTDGEPGKGRFKRVLVARLLASAAAARTVRANSPDGRRGPSRACDGPSSLPSVLPGPPAQTGLRGRTLPFSTSLAGPRIRRLRRFLPHTPRSRVARVVENRGTRSSRWFLLLSTQPRRVAPAPSSGHTYHDMATHAQHARAQECGSRNWYTKVTAFHS